MAKIVEENITIKVSKLVRSDMGTQDLVTDETLQALEQVVQELVGESVIVEVDRAR